MNIRPFLTLVHGAALVGALSGCPLFTLEAACVVDDDCPFARTCVDGRCAGRGGAEGEGEGEGEVACEVVLTDNGGGAQPISVEDDAAALAPAGASCVIVDGDVQAGAGVDSLAAMALVREIVGNFEVRNTSIVDFTGCERLTTVGNTFEISGNAALESFAGLEALAEVNSLQIQDNGPQLTDDERDALCAQVGGCS